MKAVHFIAQADAPSTACGRVPLRHATVTVDRAAVNCRWCLRQMGLATIELNRAVDALFPRLVPPEPRHGRD